MDHDEPNKQLVEQELEDDRKEASKYTIDDLKTGKWFTWLLRHALESYSKKVDASYFEKKYPGLNRDAIVDRRISLAQRYAALAGGLSASAYSGAVILTLGSGGGASPLAIPAAVVAFSTDLFYVSRLQLKLAYDMSVLYGYPVNLDDPEDLTALLKVAFGIKAGELVQRAVVQQSPKIVIPAVKAVAKGPALAFLKALPVVGKYLLQRNLIKMVIPVVAIPLSSGLNFYLTGRIAKAAQQIFRDKGLIAETATRIVGDIDGDPLLFLKTVWLVVKADNKTTSEEAALLNAFSKEIRTRDGGDEIVESFRKMVDADEAGIIASLAGAPKEVQQHVYQACCVAAAIDHKFHRKEKKLLQKIAGACNLEYDPSQVTELIKRYTV